MESVLWLCRFSRWGAGEVKGMDSEEFFEWCAAAARLERRMDQ